MIIAGYNWFVEILENDEWILQEEKLGEIINSFTTVNFENYIYVIGGYSLLAQVQYILYISLYIKEWGSRQNHLAVAPFCIQIYANF